MVPLALRNEDYTIGWVCALPLEMAAAIAMLDEQHGRLSYQSPQDMNDYTLGRIGSHNIVIACLPIGIYGMKSAATLGAQMLSTFKAIKFNLMVGIGGGVPLNSSSNDIRLGDVVVSRPKEISNGVVQYDLGKAVSGGEIIPTGVLNKPPRVLLTAISTLESERIRRGDSNISWPIIKMLQQNPEMKQRFSYQGAQNDQLFRADYRHVEMSDSTAISGTTDSASKINNPLCQCCDASKLITRPKREDNRPSIFYGTIGSGNQVIKDGMTRDKLAKKFDILCFEMEAAGLMEFPCLVIRGISDYADSHKNKIWQEYAATTAAAYAKELLYCIPASTETQARFIEEPIVQEHNATFMLMNRLYAKSDISLASLSPDRRYPNQDALIDIALIEERDFSIAIDKNFSEFASIKANSGSIFKKTIRELFLSPRIKDVGSDIRILAEESRVYTLRQPRTIFNQICDSQTTRRWLQSFKASNNQIYFVVGYRTLLNARFLRKDMKTTSRS